MNRWLQVEAALAQAQGELGIIPAEAAREIAARAALEHLDLEQIRQEYQRSRNSLLPLVKGCGRPARETAGNMCISGPPPRIS